MREIKFRVWDKYKKYFNSDYAINGNLVWGACEQEIIQEKEHLVFMQFTGLKDKNGKEIYEGDVIFYNSTGYKGEVSFSTLGGCSYYVFENGVGAEFGEKKLLEMVSDLEVIGNIYETPKLLGGITE